MKDIFVRDIFTKEHLFKDENPGTFHQEHFLKDILDCYQEISLLSLFIVKMKFERENNMRQVSDYSLV